jgi:transposase-like protein
MIEIRDPVKTSHLSLKLTRDEKRRVAAMARERGVSMSEVVRRAIQCYQEGLREGCYGQAA